MRIARKGEVATMKAALATARRERLVLARSLRLVRRALAEVVAAHRTDDASRQRRAVENAYHVDEATAQSLAANGLARLAGDR